MSLESLNQQIYLSCKIFKCDRKLLSELKAEMERLRQKIYIAQCNRQLRVKTALAWENACYHLFEAYGVAELVTEPRYFDEQTFACLSSDRGAPVSTASRH